MAVTEARAKNDNSGCAAEILLMDAVGNGLAIALHRFLCALTAHSLQFRLSAKKGE